MESLAREQDLKSHMEQLETGKKEVETEYKSHSDTTAKCISDLESKLEEALLRIEGLQVEVSSAQREVSVAKEDVKKFSEQAISTQELYERELLQHGKSMESLHRVKEEVRVVNGGDGGNRLQHMWPSTWKDGISRQN